MFFSPFFDLLVYSHIGTGPDQLIFLHFWPGSVPLIFSYFWTDGFFFFFKILNRSGPLDFLTFLDRSALVDNFPLYWAGLHMWIFLHFFFYRPGHVVFSAFLDRTEFVGIHAYLDRSGPFF